MDNIINLPLTEDQLNVISSALMHRKLYHQAGLKRSLANNTTSQTTHAAHIAAIQEVTNLIYLRRRDKLAKARTAATLAEDASP